MLNIVFLFMHSSLKVLLFNTFCIIILSACICVHVGGLDAKRVHGSVLCVCVFKEK